MELDSVWMGTSVERASVSAELFDVLNKNPEIGVYVIENGRYSYVSEGMTRILGYTQEQLLGSNPIDVCLPEEREIAASREAGRLAGSDQPPHFMMKVITRSGEIKTVVTYTGATTIRGETVLAGHLVDVTAQEESRVQLEETLQRIGQMSDDMILVLSHLQELRDPYTAGHQQGVSLLCRAIAQRLHLTQAAAMELSTAAILHDIGKINVPEEILAKPGRLSPTQFALVQEHSRDGYNLVSLIHSMSVEAEIILQHHERLDGSGYPQGLAGEEICLAARILAVADTVEAMSSHRPYRPARGIASALAEIQGNSPTKFDRAVVDACVDVFRISNFEFPQND